MSHVSGQRSDIDTPVLTKAQEKKLGELSLNNFDLPFNNPFQRKNETRDQFVDRCDRSIAGIKQDLLKMIGSGVVLQMNTEQSQSKNSRSQKKVIE